MSFKKTILLVNPWIYDFAAYDFWNKPLGLLAIAALLRNNDYNVQFVDCLDPWHPIMRNDSSIHNPRRFESGHGHYFKEIIPRPEPLKAIPKNYYRYGISPRAFRETLLQLTRPDMIFITSMMTYWYPAVFATISIVKEVFTNIPVVLGGNYVSLCPDHAARSGADIIVQGEGEKPTINLLQSHWGDDISSAPNSALLDSYPCPAYDLINPPVQQLPILTSRGCPFHCTYCASYFLYPSFRRRSPEHVFSEILLWYQRLGVQHFSLYDDAFLVHPDEMVIPLLKEIIRHRLPLNFHCPNGLHLNAITEEVAALLFDAGFKTLRFGFETSEAQRQRETGGKVTNDDFKNALRFLIKAGYRGTDIGIYILCGLPRQTAEEVKDSILFVKSFGARPLLSEYSPIPKTLLWDDAVRASQFNITDEPLFHNNSIIPCQSPLLTYDMYRSLKVLANS